MEPVAAAAVEGLVDRVGLADPVDPVDPMTHRGEAIVVFPNLSQNQVGAAQL